jgi:carbon-monoxide dehydrogenase small subunit
MLPQKIPIRLRVNEEVRETAVSPNRTLLHFLRDELHLFGTKECCSVGECGACTVLVNGRAINSCLMLAIEADGDDVVTIEGLASGEKLDPLQQAFLFRGAVQCGFCIPGMIMSAKALLLQNPQPSEEEICDGLVGNLCRCAAYSRIVEAVRDAAENRSGDDAPANSSGNCAAAGIAKEGRVSATGDGR